MLTKKAAMETIIEVLRNRWSRTWPGLLAGMFSALGLYMMILFALPGGHKWEVMIYVDTWVNRPPYFLVAGILLVTLACSLPLFFAGLGHKRIIDLSGRLIPGLITLSALALGYFGGISTFQYVEIFSAIFAFAALLLLSNAADMVARSRHAGNELTRTGKRSYALCALLCVGSIFCIYVFPLL